jgi:hypothetical protein
VKKKRTGKLFIRYLFKPLIHLYDESFHFYLSFLPLKHYMIFLLMFTKKKVPIMFVFKIELEIFGSIVFYLFNLLIHLLLLKLIKCIK